MHERNIYLARTHKNKIHNYSFDQQTGKYFLEGPDNQKTQIHKNGKMLSKFVPYCSGFLTAKQRYEQAKKEQHMMHYAPDMKFRKNKSLYTPITDKFAGYAQFPYKKAQSNLPEFLVVNDTKIRSFLTNQKQFIKKTAKNDRNRATGILIDQFIESRKKQIDKQNLFNLSLGNIIKSRPFPKNRTKNCYNNRCRLLEQTNLSNSILKQTLVSTSTNNETLNKTYFNKKLLQEQLSKSII